MTDERLTYEERWCLDRLGTHNCDVAKLLSIHDAQAKRITYEAGLASQRLGRITGLAGELAAVNSTLERVRAALSNPEHTAYVSRANALDALGSQPEAPTTDDGTPFDYREHGYMCGQCGLPVAVDEDECCTGCGCTPITMRDIRRILGQHGMRIETSQPEPSVAQALCGGVPTRVHGQPEAPAHCNGRRFSEACQPEAPKGHMLGCDARDGRPCSRFCNPPEAPKGPAPEAEMNPAPWPYHAQSERDLAAANAKIAELASYRETERVQAHALVTELTRQRDAANAALEWEEKVTAQMAGERLAANAKIAGLEEECAACRRACVVERGVSESYMDKARAANARADAAELSVETWVATEREAIDTERDQLAARVTELIRAAGVEEDVDTGRDPVEAVRSVRDEATRAGDAWARVTELEETVKLLQWHNSDFECTPEEREALEAMLATVRRGDLWKGSAQRELCELVMPVLANRAAKAKRETDTEDRTCGFCRCNTNARIRRCCIKGQAEDEAKAKRETLRR